jgi:hypothetical protein
MLAELQDAALVETVGRSRLERRAEGANYLVGPLPSGTTMALTCTPFVKAESWAAVASSGPAVEGDGGAASVGAVRETERDGPVTGVVAPDDFFWGAGSALVVGALPAPVDVAL